MRAWTGFAAAGRVGTVVKARVRSEGARRGFGDIRRDARGWSPRGGSWLRGVWAGLRGRGTGCGSTWADRRSARPPTAPGRGEPPGSGVGAAVGRTLVTADGATREPDRRPAPSRARPGRTSGPDRLLRHGTDQDPHTKPFQGGAKPARPVRSRGLLSALTPAGAGVPEPGARPGAPLPLELRPRVGGPAGSAARSGPDPNADRRAVRPASGFVHESGRQMLATSVDIRSPPRSGTVRGSRQRRIVVPERNRARGGAGGRRRGEADQRLRRPAGRPCGEPGAYASRCRWDRLQATLLSSSSRRPSATRVAWGSCPWPARWRTSSMFCCCLAMTASTIPEVEESP